MRLNNTKGVSYRVCLDKTISLRTRPICNQKRYIRTKFTNNLQYFYVSSRQRWGVLGKVFVVVGVIDGVIRVADSQVLCASLTVNMVVCSAVGYRSS